MLPRFCVEGQAEAGAVPLGQVDVAIPDDGLRQPIEDLEPAYAYACRYQNIEDNL